MNNTNTQICNRSLSWLLTFIAILQQVSNEWRLLTGQRKLKEKPMFIDLLEVILGAASSQEDIHI
jgi:hypothetical protein